MCVAFQVLGPFGKMQRKISFEMSVLRPSETAWGLSYEGFSVLSIMIDNTERLMLPLV